MAHLRTPEAVRVYTLNYYCLLLLTLILLIAYQLQSLRSDFLAARHILLQRSDDWKQAYCLSLQTL